MLFWPHASFPSVCEKGGVNGTNPVFDFEPNTEPNPVFGCECVGRRRLRRRCTTTKGATGHIREPQPRRFARVKHFQTKNVLRVAPGQLAQTEFRWCILIDICPIWSSGVEQWLEPHSEAGCLSKIGLDFVTFETETCMKR